MIFLERMTEGHHQSDEHWNCFKGNFGETSERRDGAHMCFHEHVDTILNWTVAYLLPLRLIAFGAARKFLYANLSLADRAVSAPSVAKILQLHLCCSATHVFGCPLPLFRYLADCMWWWGHRVCGWSFPALVRILHISNHTHVRRIGSAQAQTQHGK